MFSEMQNLDNSNIFIITLKKKKQATLTKLTMVEEKDYCLTLNKKLLSDNKLLYCLKMIVLTQSPNVRVKMTSISSSSSFSSFFSSSAF